MSVRPRAPFLQVEWILWSPSFFEAYGSSPYIHLVHFLAFENLSGITAERCGPLKWWPSEPLLVWRCTCKKRKC